MNESRTHFPTESDNLIVYDLTHSFENGTSTYVYKEAAHMCSFFLFGQEELKCNKKLFTTMNVSIHSITIDNVTWVQTEQTGLD